MKSFDPNDPQIKQRIIVQNSLAFAFPTRTPIVPGHLLICPKRAVATIDELGAYDLLSILKLRQILKPALMKVFGAEGFNYAWNEGEVAGQTVPHLHLHMVPRKSGDQGIWNYEPREFLYRPGSRQESPADELRNIAAEIRSNL